MTSKNLHRLQNQKCVIRKLFLGQRTSIPLRGNWVTLKLAIKCDLHEIFELKVSSYDVDSLARSETNFGLTADKSCACGLN